MSRISVDIKIGQTESTEQQEISTILVEAVIQKQKIQAFQSKLFNDLDIKKMPFLVFEVPSSIQKQYIPLLNTQLRQNGDGRELDLVVKEKEGKIFYLLYKPNTKDQFSIFVKKMQKVFSQLTTLQNRLFIQAIFYSVEEKRNKLKKQNKNAPPLKILLDQAHISGLLDIDGKFFDMFCTLVEKISPKFANSPITAFVPLLQQFSIQLELDSINDLGEQVYQQLLQKNNKQLDEKIIQKTKNVKEKISVYVWFNKLGYVKIQLSAPLLPYVAALMTD